MALTGLMQEEVMPGFPFGSQAHKEDTSPDDNPGLSAVSRFEGEMLDDSEAHEVCEAQESNFDNKQDKQNSLQPHHDHSDMREFLCKERLPLFKDIASLEEPKRLLQESIILPSRCPQLFKGVRRPWKAILMHGPPGTGKTELAKAVAGESGACFLLLAPSSLLSKFMGESERTLSQVFSYARSMAPAVIFIDEIDAFGGDRDGQTEPGLRRLMTEMLLQFNSLGEGVVVVAATNRIQDIDPALLRRFERKIEVGLLGEDDRAKLLKLKMKGTPMEPGIDLSLIAKLTNGYSGAEMELVCREAAMYGLRELLDSAGDGPALSASLTVRFFQVPPHVFYLLMFNVLVVFICFFMTGGIRVCTGQSSRRTSSRLWKTSNQTQVCSNCTGKRPQSAETAANAQRVILCATVAVLRHLPPKRTGEYLPTPCHVPRSRR